MLVKIILILVSLSLLSGNMDFPPDKITEALGKSSVSKAGSETVKINTKATKAKSSEPSKPKPKQNIPDVAVSPNRLQKGSTIPPKIDESDKVVKTSTSTSKAKEVKQKSPKDRSADPNTVKSTTKSSSPSSSSVSSAAASTGASASDLKRDGSQTIQQAEVEPSCITEEDYADLCGPDSLLPVGAGPLPVADSEEECDGADDQCDYYSEDDYEEVEIFVECAEGEEGCEWDCGTETLLPAKPVPKASPPPKSSSKKASSGKASTTKANSKSKATAPAPITATATATATASSVSSKKNSAAKDRKLPDSLSTLDAAPMATAGARLPPRDTATNTASKATAHSTSVKSYPAIRDTSLSFSTSSSGVDVGVVFVWLFLGDQSSAQVGVLNEFQVAVRGIRAANASMPITLLTDADPSWVIEALDPFIKQHVQVQVQQISGTGDYQTLLTLAGSKGKHRVGRALRPLALMDGWKMGVLPERVILLDVDVILGKPSKQFNLLSVVEPLSHYDVAGVFEGFSAPDGTGSLGWGLSTSVLALKRESVDLLSSWMEVMLARPDLVAGVSSWQQQSLMLALELHTRHRAFPLPNTFNFMSSSAFPLGDPSLRNSPFIVGSSVYRDSRLDVNSYQETAHAVAVNVVEEARYALTYREQPQRTPSLSS